jgi:hypothetical protein
MDLKNGTKNRGQKSAKNRKVVKDFLKEVFGNIGSISYASSNFIHFRKCPECERSEPLFPLNFVLQFHVLLHSGMIQDFIQAIRIRLLISVANPGIGFWLNLLRRIFPPRGCTGKAECFMTQREVFQ